MHPEIRLSANDRYPRSITINRVDIVKIEFIRVGKHWYIKG